MSLKYHSLVRRALLASLGIAVFFGSTLLVNRQPLAAAERPTFNKNTCDPRPDILPYHHYPEYRRTYNRPRFLTGWIANAIAPSSQEAMVWSENVRAGVYEYRNHPPRYKRYYSPKPWEAMQIGARPDFVQSNNVNVPSEQDRAPVQADIQEAPPIEPESTDAVPEVEEIPPGDGLMPVPSPSDARPL